MVQFSPYKTTKIKTKHISLHLLQPRWVIFFFFFFFNSKWALQSSSLFQFFFMLLPIPQVFINWVNEKFSFFIFWSFFFVSFHVFYCLCVNVVHNEETMSVDKSVHAFVPTVLHLNFIFFVVFFMLIYYLHLFYFLVKFFLTHFLFMGKDILWLGCANF